MRFRLTLLNVWVALLLTATTQAGVEPVTATS
jgi:hypothetical protein